jgi:hypothetical protein
MNLPARVAEQEYKRHNYVMSGLMLSLGLCLWFVVARGALGSSAGLRRATAFTVQ